MPSLRQVRLERAKSYILDHPDESKEQQALGCDVSTSLVALARAALIRDGLLAPSRKNQPQTSTSLAKKFRGAASDTPHAPGDRSSPDGDPVGERPPETPSKPAGMLDHAAMTAMADMIAVTDGPEMDDAEVHRRLLRQSLTFAFDSKLHPDTRMSASQLWAKLKEQTKSRNLGPGAPVSFESGVSRLSELMVACGPTMTLAAVNSAFDVKETANGKAADDQAATAGGTTQAPGAA
jgi:hypothetical protein